MLDRIYGIFKGSLRRGACPSENVIHYTLRVGTNVAVRGIRDDVEVIPTEKMGTAVIDRTLQAQFKRFAS